MVPALVMAGLSAGGALLSGMGAQQAAAKQWRLQQMENARVEQVNRDATQIQNEASQYYGQKLLETPMHESVQTLNFVDIPGFMAAAELSGFNPVTLLNSGALSMFHSTQTIRDSIGHNAADAYKMMLPNASLATAATVPNQGSMLSAVGGALSAGASTFGTQYRADQSYNLQMEKIMGTLAMQGLGLSGQNGMGLLTSYGGSGGSSGTSGADKSGALTGLPYPLKWEQGDVNVTNPWYAAKVDKTSADAEACEARYGDVAQELCGVYNFVNDMTCNATGKNIRDNTMDLWRYGNTPANPRPGSVGMFEPGWSWRRLPGSVYLLGNPDYAPYMRSGSMSP